MAELSQSPSVAPFPGPSCAGSQEEPRALLFAIAPCCGMPRAPRQASSGQRICGDGHRGSPGEAESCRRGSTASAARLNGGEAEEAKAPSADGAHDRSRRKRVGTCSGRFSV